MSEYVLPHGRDTKRLAEPVWRDAERSSCGRSAPAPDEVARENLISYLSLSFSLSLCSFLCYDFTIIVQIFGVCHTFIS